MEYSFEQYLIYLGIRSVDYNYTKETIFENIEYFRKCHKDGLSEYKSLEFFNYHLETK